MAQTEPMTLDDIQKEVHAGYLSGTDAPAFGEDDYNLRTIFINKYIRAWEMTDGIKWRELYDVDSANTLAPTVLAYPCQVSFRRVHGKVKLIKGSSTKNVTIYSQERLDDDDLDPEGYCWVSGRPGSYVLNFFGIDAQWLGSQIRFRFRRYAARMALATDVPDMSDASYLVSMVTARLFQLARNNTGYKINFDDGQDSMSGMITANTELEDDENEAPMGHRIKGFGVMGM